MRTMTVEAANKILQAPQLGDKISGRFLGYIGRSRHANFVWVACPSCGTHRWVRNSARELSHRRCTHCPPRNTRRTTLSEALSRYGPNATGKYKTILASDVPEGGDLIRGSEIGRNPLSIFKWTPCPSCGVGRWIYKNTRGNPMCKDCGNKHKRQKYIGVLSGQWKGGKIKSRYGYVYVRTYPDSPFWSMANHLGYTAEHRLVMAQHLGRPLERWEVVHHKHTRYPAGTVENKQDNRIENLELVSSKATHDAVTALENKIHNLEQQVSELKSRLAIHEAADDITKDLPSKHGDNDLVFREAT